MGVSVGAVKQGVRSWRYYAGAAGLFVLVAAGTLVRAIEKGHLIDWVGAGGWSVAAVSFAAQGRRAYRRRHTPG